MTKNVLVSISGLQMSNGDSDDVEIITAGDYYQKNGKHYIIYDEVMEGFEGIVKNTIRIHERGVDIVKKGITNVHMVFEENKKNLTCYATPFGDLMIGISTNQIHIYENEDNLRVKVDYSLDINYEHVSKCNIVVDVSSRETANLRLS